MAKNKHARKGLQRTKKHLILGIVSLLAVTCVVLWFAKNHFHSITMQQRPHISKEDKTAKTTSKQPTAQSTYTGGSPKSQPSPPSSSSEAIVTDNNGAVGSTPPASQWTSSPNGVIVVYSPAQNGLLRSGDMLSGTSSTASNVGFRLIDNVTGVIAQGSLKVVNGKFSGTFSFKTTATAGRVDIFKQAANGVESDNVSIPVRFK